MTALQHLERGDYYAIGANLAGALLNGGIAYLLTWPSPWAAVSLICVGWGLAAAISQLWFVALRVQQRAFFEATTADVGRFQREVPKIMEQQRALHQQSAQALIDGVLDGLKKRGELDPNIHVEVRLDPVDPLTTHVTRH